MLSTIRTARALSWRAPLQPSNLTPFSSLVAIRPRLPHHRTYLSPPVPSRQQPPSLFSPPSSEHPSHHGGFFRRSLPANTIIKFVPQQQAWVVERMGRFHRVLDPGLAILIPILDKITYVQSLKEAAIEIPSQSAITADNVTLDLDGVLYIRVFDPYKASYGVEDAEFAISQLAQTTMRSEIGQLTLDHVLRERAQLNVNITRAINEAAEDWGVKCLRYEIRDIHAPEPVLQAMHRLVSAERSKRAEILDSEGHRQSAINIAEGHKASEILASEAKKMQVINAAAGEAESIRLKADATSRALKAVGEAMEGKGARDAVGLRVAEGYVEAFGRLAKEGTAVVVPGNVGDVAGMVAGAMGMFSKIKEGQEKSAKRIEEAGSRDTSTYQPAPVKKVDVDGFEDEVGAEFDRIAGKKQ